MPRRDSFDVAVLGGGPAGLAAAAAAADAGAKVCLVEREERLGGILKQCIHDGFGLARFGEALTGPEYAAREAGEAKSRGVDLRLGAFVVDVARGAGSRARPGLGREPWTAAEREFSLRCVSRSGAFELDCSSLVLATGCRERTDRQVFIHGDRPAGLLTAGLAQYLVNIQGLLPGRKAVVLGSGDIGLIMARRLTLEGVEVEGVYEIKGEPSGLSRNLRQCLDDFGIPLHLSTTVTEVHGAGRLERLTVAAVDQRGAPVRGSERSVACDTLILSVGLIPENEIALALGLDLDPTTRGPRVDQSGECLERGLFCCGNALHVNDLADYVSESGALAGSAAARRAMDGGAPRTLVPLKAGSGLLYAVPQYLDLGAAGEAVVYFRANSTWKRPVRLVGRAAGDGAGREFLSRAYRGLRPPEMERVELELEAIPRDAEALVLELEREE
ncbi:MAG TPA: FAD-dependent oxidoreductase [Rectinemataceae bacterium]|nr:FAD-dependent oxidoreductase [Rectinemataceae bacterium]